MPHYVYVLKSETSQRHYYGETQDLADRIKRHNENRSKSTKNRGPWKIVISATLISKSEACKLEKKLKNMKSPQRAIAYLRKLKEK
ncbi:MAG: GIY-YIG nuclease family protein [Melioribacteraceae bacterium]